MAPMLASYLEEAEGVAAHPLVTRAHLPNPAPQRNETQHNLRRVLNVTIRCEDEDDG